MNITTLLEAEQMLRACVELKPLDIKSENMWLNHAGLYRQHLVLLKNTFEHQKYKYLKQSSTKMVKYTMPWYLLFKGAMDRLEDFENKALTSYDPSAFSAIVMPHIKTLEQYFFQLAHHFATKRRMYIEKKDKRRSRCIFNCCC
tara:strand:+ start:2336 stop:2767 length:432 start_codon:yes stop_codon:yes gene_type:complete